MARGRKGASGSGRRFGGFGGFRTRGGRGGRGGDGPDPGKRPDRVDLPRPGDVGGRRSFDPDHAQRMLDLMRESGPYDLVTDLIETLGDGLGATPGPPESRHDGVDPSSDPPTLVDGIPEADPGPGVGAASGVALAGAGLLGAGLIAADMTDPTDAIAPDSIPATDQPGAADAYGFDDLGDVLDVGYDGNAGDAGDHSGADYDTGDYDPGNYGGGDFGDGSDDGDYGDGDDDGGDFGDGGDYGGGDFGGDG